MSKAQEDRLSRNRAAREAARTAQEEDNARSQAWRTQLEVDVQQFSEACSRKLLHADQIREHSEQVQQQRLGELQRRMQESTRQKGQRLQEDCAVAAEEEAKLCDMLDNLEHVETEGEREGESLVYRQEVAQHQEQELDFELDHNMNQRLPRDERRHVCRVLRRHLASMKSREKSCQAEVPSSLGDTSNSGTSMLDDDVLSTTPTASSDSEEGSLRARDAASKASQSDHSSPLVLGSQRFPPRARSSSSEMPQRRTTNRRW